MADFLAQYNFGEFLSGVLPVMPFAGLLLSLALVPLFFRHLWDRHFDKITLGWVLLVLPLLLLGGGLGGATHDLLETMIHDYLPFIILLATLFIIAGGIVVAGYFDGRPIRNLQLLLLGTLLASIMGSMGAAMVLIRPLLRSAAQRKHQAHLVIFFIILVGNVGGALSPLGDPPLFLGFLRGVDFFWPLKNLWQPFLLTAGLVLLMFFLFDNYCWRRAGEHKKTKNKPSGKLTIRAGYNGLLLLGVIITLLCSGFASNAMVFNLGGVPVAVTALLRDGALVLLAVISYRTTPAAIHRANGFGFAPLSELAILFFGIFVTLIPVLGVLSNNNDGNLFGGYLTKPDGTGNPMGYFYLTGFFSSILDNAPTYLVFFELAGGNAAELMTSQKTILMAISLGAVFMGGNSYIGNAPNFMVKTMAEHYKIKTPHFFVYSFYALLILLPSYLLISILFFR
ncbi:MAG: sodium:proton antiporter [Hydrotalea sp.]|nr:sodium:proton antiporter [Hydrotalea sp.]